jgi:hypothetical protein
LKNDTTSCCSGVSDERRRTGIHPDDFGGNPLLGILDATAIREMTAEEAQAYHSAGVETVLDLAAMDPLSPYQLVPLS